MRHERVARSALALGLIASLGASSSCAGHAAVSSLTGPARSTATRAGATAQPTHPGPVASPSEPTAATVPVEPWDMTLLAAVPEPISNRHPWPIGPLVTGPAGLYGSGGQLVRIDPRTGLVAASASPGPVPVGATRVVPPAAVPAIAGGLVWLAPAYTSATSVALTGLDPATLAVRKTIHLRISAAGTGSYPATLILAADRTGTDLYVAAGHVLDQIDPATGQVTRTVTVAAGPIGALSVARNGHTLLLGANVDPRTGNTNNTLEVIDTATGRVVAQHASGNGQVKALTATDAPAVWIYYSGGATSTQLGLYAGIDQQRRLLTVDGHSTAPVSVSLVGGTAWITSLTQIACADPVTGKIKAQLDLPHLAQLGTVAHIGDRWLVVYRGNAPDGQERNGLATFIPPKACTEHLP